MTTIVVTRKGNQIAICGDTQSTFGETRMSEAHDACPNKIFASHGSYFAIAGSAAHDLVMQSALSKTKGLDFSSRRAIFDSFRKLHAKLKEDYFLKTEEEEDDPYESSQMTVLIANQHGIFGVYSMREVYEYRRFWAIGSGRDFAIGAMHAVYAQDELSALEIARIGVQTGCEFDVSSSLPLTAYEIGACADSASATI